MAQVSSEILILDENMSAGDENFRKKSLAKIQEFFKSGKTIIIVSHWLEYIKQNCERVIMIKNGKIERTGSSKIIG